MKTRPQAMLESKDLQNSQLAKFLEKGLGEFLKKERETAERLERERREVRAALGSRLKQAAAQR